MHTRAVDDSDAVIVDEIHDGTYANDTLYISSVDGFEQYWHDRALYQVSNGSPPHPLKKIVIKEKMSDADIYKLKEIVKKFNARGFGI